jgi:hypothetical protein
LLKPKHIENNSFSNHIARKFNENFWVNDWSHVNAGKYPLHMRHCIIYRKDFNHMHDTPIMPHEGVWEIELEPHGIWKSRSMGWMFTDDPYSSIKHTFEGLEAAVSFCQRSGLAYFVETPKDKKMEFKSYSHNFLWKGEPEVDSEDLEE